jgi:hypothetical protein
MDKNDLKQAFLKAMLKYHYREYLKYLRLLKQPEKLITPEEREKSLLQCRGIGRNVSHRAWQGKQIPEKI